MLIDSHCHIHDRGTYNYALSRQQISQKFLRKHPDFPHEPADFVPGKIIARAHAADVQKMICIGTSHEDSLEAHAFAEQHADEGIYWSYGIHPDETDRFSTDTFTAATAFVSEEIQKRQDARLVAIGEVGLDYRNGEANRQAQIKLFEQMLQLAHQYDLPLIFHIRDAFDDFFSILKNFPNSRGVVHSFSDNSKNLQQSLDEGFYVGVNGLATFAPEIPLPPLERALLETDAPFLTPSPFRGTINEPARVQDVCAYLSKKTGESEANIAEITTHNATELFRI